MQLGLHHTYGQCIISDKCKLIFLLIPKNASSTLRNYMKTKLDGYEYHYFNCNNNQKKYTTFCIFRNSIERFNSAINTILSRTKNNHPLQPIDISNMNNNNLINYIDKDEHLIKQHKFIENIRIDYIFKFEDIKHLYLNVINKFNENGNNYYKYDNSLIETIYSKDNDIYNTLNVKYKLLRRILQIDNHLNNTNAIWGQVDQPKTSNDKITYHGDYHAFEDIDTSKFTDEVLVWHRPEFPKEEWRYGLYGIKYKPGWDYVEEEDVMTIELSQPVYTPIYIEKYHIYDVFYNDNGEYVIIMPQIPDNDSPPASIKLNGIEFKLIICNSKRLKLYKLKELYNKTIQLQINNEIIETKVNKYPEFPDEIIMTTMVKNEDNYIRQWIDYHYKLGISRFIIYDNCEIDDKISYNSSEQKSNLPKILKDYIDNNIVILIRWIYKKRILPKYLVKKTNDFDYYNNDIKDIDNEISKYISGQTTQQTHSIQAFKKSKYIGLFDVDEYINPQKDNNISNLINNIINKNQIDTTEISGFIFPYKIFYNPDNLPEDGTNFLKIYNCSEIYKMPWPKLIVIPANVDIVKIHYISNGKNAYFIDEKYAYFNHYYFLNKHNRGRKRTEFIDKSILL